MSQVGVAVVGGDDEGPVLVGVRRAGLHRVHDLTDEAVRLLDRVWYCGLAAPWSWPAMSTLPKYTNDGSGPFAFRCVVSPNAKRLRSEHRPVDPGDREGPEPGSPAPSLLRGTVTSVGHRCGSLVQLLEKPW